jgi:hypothetical protein
VDPVPHSLLLRKYGSAGNRTRDLWVSSQKLWLLDHRGDHVGWILQILSDFIWITLNEPHKYLGGVPHISNKKWLQSAVGLPTEFKCRQWSSALNREPPITYKILCFHGGDYEECRLLGYKNPVRTSQKTHYVSATELSGLMLCKVWGIHGSDYEEWRLLGYKTTDRTSQETRHVSSTEPSPLML